MSQTAVGIDIGGSHVEYGLMHENRVVAAQRFPVAETSLTAVLQILESGIPAMVQKAGIELSDLAGIAVGICAIVGRNNTVLATNGKYDDGVGFDFAQWSKTNFGLRCRAENDTRLALLGEHAAGSAAGYDDAVLITLGTGIGGAVMLSGTLLRSSGNRAGGLAGHLGVAWNGRICSCGNRGCAEAEASSASLDAICRQNKDFGASALAASSHIHFEQLFAAAVAQDSLACHVLDHCMSVWAALTVSLIHAYDPQVVVFGGGVMRQQEMILPRISAHVDRHAWIAPGSVKIVASTLGSSAALLGALPLLRDQP